MAGLPRTELARQILEAGLTNTEVGRRARVHPNRVGAIANARAVPPRDSVELVRLARALGYDGDPAHLLDPIDEGDPAA